MSSITRALLLIVATAGVSSAQAPAAAPKADAPTLRIAVRNQTAEAERAAGSIRADGAARPGDILLYTLTFSNPTARPMANVQLSNPLPTGLAFVSGSVRASRTDAVVEYSADGGATFSDRPTEIVTIDGQRARRAIPAERYTNVRWVVRGAVAPRSVVTAEYRARVGAPAAAAASSPAAPNGR